jgi:hypothetical protein
MIDKILTRNGAMIVSSLAVISVLVIGLNITKPDKPTDRIRIKQTVEYTSFISKSEFYLKTEIFVNDKLTVSDADFGTYKEIDSLKCIRYCEAQQKVINLNKLKNKKCN